jgi:hypothetical protein
MFVTLALLLVLEGISDLPAFALENAADRVHGIFESHARLQHQIQQWPQAVYASLWLGSPGRA